MNQMEEGVFNGSQKRILAVDDTAIVLTRIVDTLRSEYEVITANSGVRALKYLRQEKPDLILMDIQMPNKDGIETLREIRAMKGLENIPVIMLTGMENKSSVVESARLGICDYILKPFSSEDLRARIRRVLEPEGERDIIKLWEEAGGR